MSTGDHVGVDSDAPTDVPTDSRPVVTASHTSPDRTVFTETANTDAWIATDFTVDLER